MTKEAMSELLRAMRYRLSDYKNNDGITPAELKNMLLNNKIEHTAHDFGRALGHLFLQGQLAITNGNRLCMHSDTMGRQFVVFCAAVVGDLFPDGVSGFGEVFFDPSKEKISGQDYRVLGGFTSLADAMSAARVNWFSSDGLRLYTQSYESGETPAAYAMRVHDAISTLGVGPECAWNIIGMVDGLRAACGITDEPYIADIDTDYVDIEDKNACCANVRVVCERVDGVFILRDFVPGVAAMAPIAALWPQERQHSEAVAEEKPAAPKKDFTDAEIDAVVESIRRSIYKEQFERLRDEMDDDIMKISFRTEYNTETGQVVTVSSGSISLKNKGSSHVKDPAQMVLPLGD